MSADLKKLGALVRQERESRQLSQESLADLSGLSRSYIGEIERGAVSVSFASLAAVAKGLSLSLEELVARYEQQ
ncbi:MAG: helix-turn-helix transcriptional regulator [Rhodospirillales bacterium]